MKEKLLYLLISCLVLATLIFGLSRAFGNHYNLEYVEYTPESGDTLNKVVYELNKDYDGYYDVRDLVHHAKEKNDIADATIVAGESYKMPVLIHVEDKELADEK